MLADLTIGLTFFFAVLTLLASLANSQGVLAVQRSERQAKLRNGITSAFGSVYPGTKLIVKSNSRGDDFVDLVNSQGVSIGQIWENGNFQRIMIYPDTYVVGESELTADGSKLYRAIGDAIKFHAPSIGYLFVHGIVEPSESGISDSAKKQALALSRARADDVHSLFVKMGLIAPSAAEFRLGQIELKYSISYGTGAELYTRESFAVENWGSMKTSGRVDIVLFYRDEIVE